MDVAYKQGLCSVEIYSSRPCFRSPVRESATKFKVVTENLLLQERDLHFQMFFFFIFSLNDYISSSFGPNLC